MPTLLDLKERADRALFGDRYGEALALYTEIVELAPGNLDARMRVADALMALGDVQRAAVVYTQLARHAALAGYPLRALVALKVLSALEPKLGVLLDELAKLYCRDSARLGPSVRKALPSLEVEAPGIPAPVEDLGALSMRAERAASRYEDAGLVYPDKLMPIPLLSLLDQREFTEVLGALRLLRARPGAVIVREGEPGRSFYVLARGSVEVTALRGERDEVLARLHEGAIFGEMALLTAASRTATVAAVSDCDLLEFDCAALTAASSTLTDLAVALSSFARERLLKNVVSTSALFAPLDPKQRLDLMRRFVAAEVPPSELIVREGEAGRGLYVVLRGEVVVTRDRQEIARLGPGEVFGEISLLHAESTTADVCAGAQGASLLFLGREYFERLVAAVPELHAHLARLSEDRLMDLRLSSVEVDEASSDDEDIDVEVLL